MSFSIRRATFEDKQAWLHMRHGLWPYAPLDYLELDLDRLLEDERKAVFVAVDAGGRPVGFLEAGLRDTAEGSETSPVGYIEAWYVEPHMRGMKIGRDLVYTAEQWAREKGCREMASDTWIDNEPGIQVHRRLGYQEVDRLVHFVKRL
jgi:aminoglycoside 6'-N-acetyltransferase I